MTLAISTKWIDLLERHRVIKELVWFGARWEEAQVRAQAGPWLAASIRAVSLNSTVSLNLCCCSSRLRILVPSFWLAGFRSSAYSLPPNRDQMKLGPNMKGQSGEQTQEADFQLRIENRGSSIKGAGLPGEGCKFRHWEVEKATNVAMRR